MNYPSQAQDMSYMIPKYSPQNAISPTQLIAPNPQHQIPSQHLTLTPAQLLQQQQLPTNYINQNSQMRIPFQPPIRYPHERAPFLRHHIQDRPEHERAHDPPYDRAQSIDLQADRPSSSASARSHHSHPPHEQPPMMPPPSSRPGTASGPTRMNLNTIPLAPMIPQSQQPPINPGVIQMAIPMNRPPTRTGSALGRASPKHSPRMGLGPMAAPPPVPPSVQMQGPMVPGMGSMAGPMGVPMNTANIGPPINGNLAIGIPPQGIPHMQNMGPMGQMNMNTSTPSTPSMMGPPVLPQGMQRLDREPMMQQQSIPVPRESVGMVAHLTDQPHGMPQSSTAPFMGLDNPGVPPIGPSIPTMPRQSSQPPPQQSPARQVPPPHRSPMPPMRKMSEIPGPAATPPVNVPPIPGTTPGQKLPPHIASLNPAVTKISYLPYVVPPKPSDASDPTSDEDKKPSPDGSTTDTDKDATTDTNPPVKIEDPVRMLTPSEIAQLKDVMVRDSAYETVYRAKQARMQQELRTAGPSGRLPWWDRDFAAANVGINRRPERFDVRYPRPARTDNSMGARKKGARREGIRMSVYSFLHILQPSWLSIR